MKISSSFFAGILWTAMLAPSIAAFAQTQNNQAALAKQSSIVFSGTVSQLGATSFAGIPQSPNTIVVRVDSVLKKPPAISLKKGDNVTVELKDPSAFEKGTQATFYTEGWIFGSGVAVKELGHEFSSGGETPASGASAAESALVQAQKQISDQDLQNRIASSELVVIGRVTDVHRWTIPKSAVSRYHTSEHSADWHEAVLQIDSVLKGTKPKKGKMVVRFPLSRDVAWVNSPKFEKLQQGIFFLKKDQVSGDPTASLGGYQVDVYTCLKPGDWLPLSEESHVRALLKN
jgi:hypothetical protein